ncbi:MAG: ADP-forming succinate--CoA ligase subunit beta [Gammaproteobacteria bacterium]|nr:ADP-forming succinate--CoA ligase subunit beta [Gammaproteobacteria bacterium]
MKLHEFQAKQLFTSYRIPVPSGGVAESAEAAAGVASSLDASRWVVKAQVHAGGRGKGGGVKLVDNVDAVAAAAAGMIGRNLVTPQTDETGLPIHQVLIEVATPYRAELYLGALVDRAAERVVFMASAAGGMDIEHVAATTPEKILTVHVDPVVGLQGYQCRKLGFGLGLDVNQVKQLTGIMSGLYKLFTDKDASLVEINPLVITEAGDLLALDAKINLDDNALYRQQAMVGLRDETQEDEKERIAVEHQLNYVTLDGSIGCMVNGAGLAMATMDLIKLHGGEPANFLDVGGGVTAERVAEAFKLILSDPKVKAILVNIFGGIVRCDLIADGIIQAVQTVDVGVPVVVRLEGTNADRGRALLAESGMNITAAEALTDAARKVVAAAGQA